MQYVEVKFRPGDRRAYTYEWDGEPFKVGDMVKVPGKLPTDGWTALPVHGVHNIKPPFACKAILGAAPPKEGEQPQLGLDELAAESPDRNAPKPTLDGGDDANADAVRRMADDKPATGNWPGGASGGSDPADQ